MLLFFVFNYCSDVWHFCSKRSKDKLEQLNKQALRTGLNSNSETLLRIIGSVNLESSRVQNMLLRIRLFTALLLHISNYY